MLPKSKQYAAIVTQTSKLISQPVDETRYVFHNAGNVASILPDISDDRTISDVESIDKAQQKLESTHGIKCNTVNERDFLFTEETVEQNNCNMHTSKSANNNCNKNISDIELNTNIGEKIFIKEEITGEEDMIKTEYVVVEVKKEAPNSPSYTTVYKGAGIDGEECYTDTKNVNINNEKLTISIKEESTSEGESVLLMPQDGRRVDKSSEVCEVIKRSHKGSNNSLSLLRNWTNKMPTDCKELVVLFEDIVLTKYNTEHSSKQVTVNAVQSTKNMTKKVKNETHIKNENIFVDDLEMGTEFSADYVETVKFPQSVINAPGSSSHNIKTNGSVARKKNKLILSGTEYLQKLFICDICDKSFHHKPTLILHIKKHPKLHYCTYCSYTTCLKGNLKEHVNARHTRSISFKCPHCSYKAYKKSNLLIHVNIKHTKSEVFNCSYCSYKAYRKSHLLRHVNSKHTKSEVFNCPHCSYKAYQKFALSLHVNIKHTKSEVLNCPHCSYKAYAKSTLAKHINTKHTKSVFFNCTQCSYKAYQKWILEKHVNTKHTRNRDFNCPYCSYKAYEKSDLSKHVNTKHTKSEVFNCPQCSYKAYAKSTLTKHIKAKHTKRIFFNCTDCSYKAYQKSDLTKHVNTKHTKNQVFNSPC